MKQYITKLLSVLLAVVLVVGLLPATALAWAVYDLWVSGVQVTGLNAKDVLSDGGSVVFTSATGSEPAKLTLKNADIVGTSLLAHPDDNFGIYSEIDLTLELHGKNTITAEDAVSDAVSCGISMRAFPKKIRLVIVGDGTLNVTAGKGDSSWAVRATEMTMRGGTVRATAGEASRSAAVSCIDFVMEGGTLAATSGKTEISRAVEADAFTMLGGTLEATAANGESNCAIEAMEMTMQNGTVRAAAGDATEDSVAVYSDELIMEGGTLEATAGKGEISYAVETDKMTIRGGAIRATAGEATKNSDAVYCNDLVMEGGTLEATADKGEYSCGVDSTNFTILGGTVRATGGEGSEGSYGVYCDKDLVMEGGTLEATAGKAKMSCAVEANEMTVRNGIIRAISGEATDESIALRCFDLVMESGTLEATAGKAKNSCAIDADEMTVRSGTIRATAGEASEGSSAVYSDQSIVMEGGTLEATAGKAEYSFGVDSTSFTLLGGTVRATGGEGSEESYGVFDNFKGEFIIEGGVLIAAGGPADGSYGIYKLNGMKGGTVTAIGQTRAYYNYPMLDGFKDPVVTVSEQPSGTGAVSWNDTDSLNYDLFKYVRIAPYNPFNDVPDGQYYYEPVLWAIGQEPQITTGTSADRFSPNATCTRAQVVTFLWRASGEPEPTKTENPFSDVKEGQYYYKAVLWAVEKGITTGTSSDKFSPNAGCTRGQVVTFLHRAQGKPMPGSLNNPFTDVAEGQYYYAAVLWAVHHSPQITTGTSADKFSPDATCTRGQIVTFLYRSMK